MKKFEYKNFHFKPVIQPTVEQFGAFIFEKLNEIGAQGWQAIEVKTPSMQPNVLSGDVLILAMREVLPDATPDIPRPQLKLFD